MFRGVVVLICLLGASGCADDRPGDWDYVYSAILRPNCATAACHSAIVKQSGLDMSTPDRAYQTLVRRPCGSTSTPAPTPTGANVDPGHPETSAILYWLRGRDNQTMPPDVPLPEAEIEAVERWIREGATCD